MDTKCMDLIIGNIKAAIDAKGLKYKAVASMAEIDTGRFYRIMQRATPISCDEIAAVCLVLGVTPNDIYGVSKSA